MFAGNFNMKGKFWLTGLEYQLGPLKQIVRIDKSVNNKKMRLMKWLKWSRGNKSMVDCNEHIAKTKF